MCTKIPDKKLLVQTWENTHTKNRVFCDVYNKGFQYDSSLRQHLRVHTRKGLFKCDKCTKQFTTKSVMKQHAKTHIHKGKFKCELCIFRSDTAYNLKQHMRGKHGRGGNLFVATDSYGNLPSVCTKRSVLIVWGNTSIWLLLIQNYFTFW